MTIRQTVKVLSPLVLLVLGLCFGCAQQMKSVKTETATEASMTAQIQSITVADDGSRVEIVSNKPIVYTYYMLESPPRVIVDIAQTTPGNQPMPMIVNTVGVKQLDVSRHEFGSGVLCRIDIALNSKTEISASLDQKDKKRLILSIPVAVTEQQSSEKQSYGLQTIQISEPKPVPAGNSGVETQAVKPEPEISAVEPALLASSAPTALKAGERALTAIKKDNNSLFLETSAEPESFKAFKLTQPDRLVIDIPKTRSVLSSKIVAINTFNLGNARIGTAADKLRIVFDATGTIPRYNVTKNSAGLKVAFEEAVNKQVETITTLPAAKNESNANSKEVIAKELSSPPSQEPVKSIKAVESYPEPTSTLEGVKSPSSPPAISSGLPPTDASRKKLPAGVVSAVEFTQIDEVSRITIKTTGGCIAGEPVKSKQGYLLSIKGCRLPVDQQRPLVTTGFNSEIQSIAPYSVKGGVIPQTRIAVNLRHPIPNTVQKDGDIIQWDFLEPVKLKPAVKKVAAPKKVAATVEHTAEAALEKDVTEVKTDPLPSKSKSLEEAFLFDKASQSLLRPGKNYTGRKVTLEFSDADIKKIFQLLAEVSNQNILVSDDVTGTISLKLVNVPWDQALDVILENKGLGMQKEGNIIQIRPRSKMKSLDDEAVEMRLTEEKKMPLSTVIFDINFAALGDIENQFKNIKSKRSDASISSDMRTNKIIVVDIDPNISKMRKLLEQLDVPEKQVMIEARIVEASSTFARDIGVKWGFGYSDGSASIGNINAAAGTMGGVVSSVVSTAASSGLATGVSFGKLLSNFQLDMRLSAAASIGQIKIVSTPKVMTVNNKPAKISQGQMIPYQNTTSTDGATTQFVEAALSLEVTPHITSDGSVNMKIKASNNTAGAGIGGAPPPINKKEATTELVVRDGETTVIGGIYVDSETEGDSGVPYLSDIPLFGNLFKSNSKNKVKNEMLIFITPRILN